MKTARLKTKYGGVPLRVFPMVTKKTMRAFLNTSVVFSGIFFNGIPRGILEYYQL
jgi:hypothetical protein